jgi:hypothetical protein
MFETVPNVSIGAEMLAGGLLSIIFYIDKSSISIPYPNILSIYRTKLVELRCKLFEAEWQFSELVASLIRVYEYPDSPYVQDFTFEGRENHSTNVLKNRSSATIALNPRSFLFHNRQ